MRIVLKVPRWSSASEMFVSNNVPTFNAVLRNFMYGFMCRLIGSKNMIIMSIADVSKSDTRYTSCFGSIGPDACICFNDALSASFLNVLYCFIFMYMSVLCCLYGPLCLE